MAAAAAPLYAAQETWPLSASHLAPVCHFPGSTGRRHRSGYCHARRPQACLNPNASDKIFTPMIIGLALIGPSSSTVPDRFHSSGKNLIPLRSLRRPQTFQFPSHNFPDFSIFHEPASRSGTLVQDEADDAFPQTDPSTSESDSGIQAPWEEPGVRGIP